MDVTGTIAIGGAPAEVTGEAWFDHQWGNFSVVDIGWDWFSLRLDDGTDLMLYQLRDAEGNPVEASGTYVSATGETEVLEGGDFSTEATGSWVSPGNRATYPMGWRVSLPSRRINLTLTPIVRDAEFDATATTGNFYWEGAVVVSGSHSGVGFVELVGYAPSQIPGR